MRGGRGRKRGPGRGLGTQGDIWPPPSLPTPPIQPASPSLGLFALTLCVFLKLSPGGFYLSLGVFSICFFLSFLGSETVLGVFLPVCVPLRISNSLHLRIGVSSSPLPFPSNLVSSFSPLPSPARNFALIW